MENTKGQPLAVIETRVSDPRQLDGSHEMQEAECRRLAAELGVEVDRVWNTTISGSVEDRESFAEILEHIENRKGRVKFYICLTIERLTRAGPTVYQQMKKELKKRGVQMKDVRGIIQPEQNVLEHFGVEYEWSTFSPSDTAELVEANNSKGNKREMLARMIGQEIINAREGYAVHAAPDGYINVRERYFVDGKAKRRSTRKHDDVRAPYYEKMFELRAEGLKTDEQIVAIVNKMGYRSKVRNRWGKGRKGKVGTSGGIPLTVKQLQVIVQRPVYAGVNYEKWVPVPVKAQYPGIVSIDTWNRANRGKLFIKENAGGMLEMLQNYVPEVRTHGNPLYPYKDVIRCHVCGKPFFGSASRGKSGKHHPAYHCTRKVNGVKHKRVGGNKQAFEEQVEDFVHDLSFDMALWKSFELVLMDVFREKQASVMQAAAGAGRRVAELQDEKAAATQAYIAANRAGDEDLKRDIQAERARIEQEIRTAQGYRNSLEVSERDMEDFLSRAEWIMEHPADFLLGARNMPQRQAYFSLMFDELPTYQDVIDGTPKLSWVFKLKDDSTDTQSDNVRREGFEPP